MALPTWPATLPDNFLQDDYNEGIVDNLIQTEMASGPSKRRPRSTVAYRPTTGSMYLDTVQKGTMQTFYTDTIGYGALPFTMPTYGGGTMDIYLDGYTTVPLSGDLWKMTMNFRQLI